MVKPQNPADSALPATLSNFCPRRCLPAPLRDISKNCQGTIFALENKIFRRKIPALTQARRFCGFFKSSKPAVFSRLENLKVFKLPPGTVKGERASALSCSPGLFGQFETAKPANAKIARIKRKSEAIFASCVSDTCSQRLLVSCKRPCLQVRVLGLQAFSSLLQPVDFVNMLRRQPFEAAVRGLTKPANAKIARIRRKTGDNFCFLRQQTCSSRSLISCKFPCLQVCVRGLQPFSSPLQPVDFVNMLRRQPFEAAVKAHKDKNHFRRQRGSDFCLPRQPLAIACA